MMIINVTVSPKALRTGHKHPMYLYCIVRLLDAEGAKGQGYMVTLVPTISH